MPLEHGDAGSTEGLFTMTVKENSTVSRGSNRLQASPALRWVDSDGSRVRPQQVPQRPQHPSGKVTILGLAGASNATDNENDEGRTWENAASDIIRPGHDPAAAVYFPSGRGAIACPSSHAFARCWMQRRSSIGTTGTRIRNKQCLLPTESPVPHNHLEEGEHVDRTRGEGFLALASQFTVFHSVAVRNFTGHRDHLSCEISPCES